MKSNIQIFRSEEFGSIRTLTDKDGEPWFVGKDVAGILGYSNPTKAIRDRVFEEDKMLVQLAETQRGSKLDPPCAGKTNIMVINESGLYSLILSSKLESAKRFKRWVTSEVLPQIRRTGGYFPTHDNQGGQLSDEEIMAQALQISQRTIEQQQSLIDRQQQTIEQQQPKALFYDCVAVSDDTCSVAEMAKMIEANGYPMGQKRLFEWLRNNGYLCTRRGQFFNTPYQIWVERGLFRIETNVGYGTDGIEYVNHTTRITGRGQAYLLSQFFAPIV